MARTRLAATSSDEFLERTNLLPDLILDGMFQGLGLTAADEGWFREHADLWARWFHANDPKWKRWMEGKLKRINPPAQLRSWFAHWISAYAKNPDSYRRRHPMDELRQNRTTPN